MNELEVPQAKSGDDADRIIDFVSGQPVKAGPEEVYVTQPFSRMLVEDYGYPKEHIQTRPQWRVKANPSDSSKSVPVDIAVFNGSSRHADDLQIIVECKSPDSSPEETSDRQIFNYLNWSSATIGVWTNGTQRFYWHKVQRDGRLAYEPLPSFPRFGEKVSEMGRYRRKQLRKPQNLQQMFRAIRAHLAGNALGTTRDEVIAVQMINLIFCKIFDEKFTAPDDLLEFRAGVDDTPDIVLARIDKLFEDVKIKYSEVFSEDDRLTLDAESVRYVVGELQAFCLTEAGRDAVGEAFEVFIGQTLKGDQGQFFTPRNVIELMVNIADPSPDDRVIDPACGAGGFLIEALKHKWSVLESLGAHKNWGTAAIQEEKTASAIKTIFGVDKDDFLVKVAKAYMAIMGDGKGSIYSEDSLEPLGNWARAQSAVHLGSFDIVLANPPFGKEIKVRGEKKLRQYRLGHKWGRDSNGSPIQKKTVHADCNPQVLFVERCLQLARDGGLVGIILPETYFHSPTTSHVREVLLRENNVVALIDLPHNTFRPFNNAKCVAVIVQKGRPQEDRIKAVVAMEMGHNHLGKEVYRYDPESRALTSEIWDDISAASKSLRKGEDSPFIFDISAKEAAENDVWVPRYYWSEFNDNIDLPSDVESEWVTLGELIDDGTVSDHAGHGSPSNTDKGGGTYTYARVKDIVNWEIYRDRTSGVSRAVMEQFTQRYPLRQGDILYVARGSYRIGDVAIAGPLDLETVLTREIRILRVNPENSRGLSSEYLLYLLSTPQVRKQTVGKVFMDTTLPNIGDRYRSLKLPWAKDIAIRKRIHERVSCIVQSRWDAIGDMRQLLDEAI